MGEARAERTRRAIVMVLDATPSVGVGHATRCQALAEELLSRGFDVRQVGRLDVDWVTRAYRSAGIEMLGPVGADEAAASDDVVAVVVDSYSLPISTSRALAGLGRPVLAVVDGDTLGQVASLYLDHNLGATPEALGVDPASALCGPRYALLRDLVLGVRHGAWEPAQDGGPDRVTVMFGGTDPKHGAAVVARLLAAGGPAMDVTIVAASPAHADELAAVHWSAHQRAQIVAPDPEFVQRVASADLVISAGGTSVYELMALGRPAVLCYAADNQVESYRRIVDGGLAVGLGSIEGLRSDQERATKRIGEVFADKELRTRMASAGQATVDGRGRVRVADHLLALAATPVHVRRATADDEALLLEWRNDETTRAWSRTTAAVAPDDHAAWLRTVLTDDDRILLIGETSDDEPVGTVRFDRHDDTGVHEVSVTVAPAQRGRGIGTPLILAGEAALRAVAGDVTVLAYIKPENSASMGMFARCGYRSTDRSDAGGLWLSKRL